MIKLHSICNLCMYRVQLGGKCAQTLSHGSDRKTVCASTENFYPRVHFVVTAGSTAARRDSAGSFSVSLFNGRMQRYDFSN